MISTDHCMWPPLPALILLFSSSGYGLVVQIEIFGNWYWYHKNALSVHVIIQVWKIGQLSTASFNYPFNKITPIYIAQALLLYLSPCTHMVSRLALELIE